MKRMLFNATQSEELRVATINENKLEDLDFERGNQEQRKSNIYKAVVTRIEPSLEAAFVNYGVDRHGFLPFKEISPDLYSKKSRKKSISIKDVMSEGQELVVQVSKDERGNKGAALTTYLSLAGRYIVLMPNNNDGGGISRRVEGEERAQFKEILSQVKVKKGMSVIGRTAGIGASVEEIQWDLDYLNQLWAAIAGAADAQSGAFLIYQESNLVVRAIRDYFNTDIEEIIIDKQSIFDQAHQFMSHVMPNYAERIKFYDEEISLFTKYGIENQIESAFLREVQLPSGGAIVIDHTEALVSIDVNSSRSTKGRDIESTAFNTNIEAAIEISKQLRLRDIGGLIVIDFIDMENQKNQRSVENKMRDELKHDKARIQTNKISRFGLLEISRQRLRPSLGESISGVCPRCEGTGRVRDIQSTALSMLRTIEQECNKEKLQSVAIQLPIEVATLLLNEKRNDIKDIETKSECTIVVIPNRYFEIPKFHIERSAQNSGKASYKVVEQPLEEDLDKNNKTETKQEKLEPAVKQVVPNQVGKKNKSIFGFIKDLITPSNDEVSDESSEGGASSDKAIDEEIKRSRPDNRQRNNRNRRSNRNRKSNYKDKFPKDNAVNNSAISPDKNPSEKSLKETAPIEVKVEEKPVLAKKPVPTKPKRKKTEELPKVDLNSVGLKLVETSSKPISEPKKENTKKAAPKKVADWQKQKTDKKDTKELVMVETKTTKVAKLKKTTKPKAAPKIKKAKVTSKKD